MHRRTFLGAAAAGALPAALMPRAGSVPPPPTPITPLNDDNPYQVLYVAAHQDDAWLQGSSAIASELAAGHQVSVLTVTDGAASNVRSSLAGVGVNTFWGCVHVPEDEGYSNQIVDGEMDATAFTTARRLEEFESHRVLSSGSSTQIQTFNLSYPDSQASSWDLTQLAADITAVCDLISPAGGQVHLKTHTYLATSSGGTVVEAHPDHYTVGQVVQGMAAANPTRYSDNRYFIFWARYGVTFSGLSTHTITPAAAMVPHIRAAAKPYYSWAPSAGLYCIGRQSVDDFDTVLATPKSIWHA